MFITWKTVENHELRGCIGTTSPVNLIDGLRQYSIKSALQDGRFSPVKVTELEKLVCSISVLTDFEECQDFNDWTIGVHGISIALDELGKIYRAIFLPEVMIEHGNEGYI